MLQSSLRMVTGRLPCHTKIDDQADSNEVDQSIHFILIFD